jgi:hypothetical protein
MKHLSSALSPPVRLAPAWTRRSPEPSHASFRNRARDVNVELSVDDAGRMSSGLSFRRAIMSLLGVTGLTLLVPFFVVLLPMAIAYRLLLGATGWPSWMPRSGGVIRSWAAPHRPAQ